MFLTGQLFPRPWDEPEEEVQVKRDTCVDSQTNKIGAKSFYDSSNTVVNMWNNPSRACKKVKAFYHDKEKAFKDNTYTDQEIMRMDAHEKEKLRKVSDYGFLKEVSR